MECGQDHAQPGSEDKGRDDQGAGPVLPPASFQEESRGVSGNDDEKRRDSRAVGPKPLKQGAFTRRDLRQRVDPAQQEKGDAVQRVRRGQPVPDMQRADEDHEQKQGGGRRVLRQVGETADRNGQASGSQHASRGIRHELADPCVEAAEIHGQELDRLQGQECDEDGDRPIGVLGELELVRQQREEQ
ncbi:MAG: hypothetical protein BWY59_01168 [Verrucomicrobia bacterium ADurb.Bin345]|nr:MAG: hypothetical protein BWY59_01168 [Verrucomicrobia bacterium ADurb.Bin345]